MLVRVPGWSNNKLFPTDLYHAFQNSTESPKISLNGSVLNASMNGQGYFRISRNWKNGDEINLSLPIKTQLVESNEKIKANKNLLAFQRGPLMYCAEFADNNDRTSNLIINIQNKINEQYEASLLNGVMTLNTEGKVINISADGQDIHSSNKNIKLIPYYARSNRGIGEMQMWFPTKVTNLKIEHQ